MRHRNKTAKLSRPADHRKALLRNLATSLALHGKLTTTSTKAKALISFYESLISLTKRADKVNAIRRIKKYLFTEAAQKAFMKRLDKIDKKSGNLRAIKIGSRQGDRAEMSLVEFVEVAKKAEKVEKVEKVATKAK